MDITQFINQLPFFAYGFLFIIGVSIGSFLNVVIIRLPPLIDDSSEDIKIDKPNLIKPGSHCLHCKTKINWYDNIPIMSYLLLKAQCRHCHQPISRQYILVEILTAVICIILAYRFAFNLNLLPWLIIFSSLLICLAVIDFNTFLLPDALTFPGIALGLAINYFQIIVLFKDALLGCLIGYSLLWIIYKIHFSITKREGMGYGDFKLLAMLGAWLGWQALPIILLISSISGIVLFLILKVTIDFKHTQAMPFGPMLCMAAFLYLITITTLSTF